MCKLYLLSGLGADKRVFDYLDLSGFEVNYIEWISPHNNETIEQYAARLCLQIKDENPVLVGVSFGGIMAVEIAKQIKTNKVVLISSAKAWQEIPWYYRLAGKVSLHKCLPSALLLKPNVITYKVFGVKSKSAQKLLRDIMAETEPIFFRWAIDKIVHWKNEIRLFNLVHIHGSRDKVIPLKSADYVIKDGGHLMIVDRSDEVSAALKVSVCGL